MWESTGEQIYQIVLLRFFFLTIQPTPLSRKCIFCFPNATPFTCIFLMALTFQLTENILEIFSVNSLY